MTSPYPVSDHASKGSQNPIRSMDDYRRVYQHAALDPEGFWLEQTHSLIQWQTPPTMGLEGDFRSVRSSPLRWFADGVLNVTESCLDRHADAQPDATAILWEGDEPGDVRTLSYATLLEEVCRVANVLADLGIQKGDRVIVYMGMVPEAAVAMLACARLGAVHSVVFGGFSAQALRDRISDCSAEVVITQDEGRRGGRTIPLKRVVDEALLGPSTVRKVLVLRHTGSGVAMTEGRDVDWKTASTQAAPTRPATPCDAEDPLFILYTSGSTGRPKGLVHTCGGYITYTTYTHRTVFDLRPGDIYACVADVGWITGHSYIVYGPLSNGATTFMFESTPLYPNPGRYWDMVERHKITVFYTAPTAIRAIAAHGTEPVARHDTSSLRVLGTVGEPIDPESWIWYYEQVGKKECSIVDTWWQTETGGICISPIASATPTLPGSATFPLPGIEPLLVDADGRELRGPAQGYLCINHPWPGQARTVFRDHERFVATYFSTYPGRYFTGDGCKRNAQGYHWITGRVDDVLNVSGHRMGTAEFEAVLLLHDAVAEAAVIGYPHPIKGQGVYTFVVLQPNVRTGETFLRDLNQLLRENIGAHARLDALQIIPGLPKTRSGKVMRRIMRKICEGASDQLGDTSTLADPSVVDAIIEGFQTP